MSAENTSQKLVGRGQVLRLAWPLIIANSFWNIQVTVDRIFLGHYSTDALGAAMAAVGIFWAPMALVQQTAAYLSTFVAQYFGARRSQEIGAAVWQSIYLSVIGGLLFLLFIPLSDLFFSSIGHPGKLPALESSYFKALTYSALPTALVAAASAFFTGLGKSRVIMWINGVGLVFNVIFDYLLIFGHAGFPQLGIAGAGYATALANWVAAVFGLYLVFQRVNEREYKVLSSWRFDPVLMKRFIKFGIPSGLQWALEGLAFTVFMIFLGRLPNGSAALAGSSITVTILMLSILPAMGVAQAVAIYVGQYLGEDKPSLAEAASWSGLQLAWMYIAFMGLTFLLFPGFYLSWFSNPENQAVWQEVTVIVPRLLIFVAVFTLFDCSNLIFSFALKGAGDTRFVTMVALLLPWPIMVLPTWYVSHWQNGLYWAWAAASAFIMIQAVIFWRRFAGGKWKSMRVID